MGAGPHTCLRANDREYPATMNITVVDDSQSLASAAADLIQGEIDNTRRLAIGLSGGTTPRATYEELASRNIEWPTVVTWLIDDRWVAPMHADSNQRMIRESLVRSTGVQFLAPDTTLHSPGKSAGRFTEIITGVLATASRRLTLLGIGTDGHTASLFPGTSALNPGGPRYVENFIPDLDAWRLTATFGLLGESDVVCFLVAGESKAAIVAAIAAGADVPANMVTAKEKVVWLLDSEAASAL